MIATARPNLSDRETWELEELVAKYKDVFVTNGSNYRQTECTTVSMLEKPDQFNNPLGGSLQQNRQKRAWCSRTCNNVGLSNSQTAPGHLPSFWSRTKTRTSVSEQITGSWMMSERKTVSHCLGLTIHWTCSPEPNSSPPSIWRAVIGRWHPTNRGSGPDASVKCQGSTREDSHWCSRTLTFRATKGTDTSWPW
jgi:hypothetical protein